MNASNRGIAVFRHPQHRYRDRRLCPKPIETFTILAQPSTSQSGKAYLGDQGRQPKVVSIPLNLAFDIWHRLCLVLAMVEWHGVSMNHIAVRLNLLTSKCKS